MKNCLIVLSLLASLSLGCNKNSDQIPAPSNPPSPVSSTDGWQWVRGSLTAYGCPEYDIDGNIQYFGRYSTGAADFDKGAVGVASVGGDVAFHAIYSDAGELQKVENFPKPSLFSSNYLEGSATVYTPYPFYKFVSFINTGLDYRFSSVDIQNNAGYYLSGVTDSFIISKHTVDLDYSLNSANNGKQTPRTFIKKASFKNPYKSIALYPVHSLAATSTVVEFMVLYYTYDQISTYTSYLKLYKFDKNLNLIDSSLSYKIGTTDVSVHATDISHIHGPLLTDGTNYYWYTTSEYLTEDKQRCTLIKLDKNMKLLWKAYLGIGGVYDFLTLHDFKIHNDKIYMLMDGKGNFGNKTISNNTALLLKLNALSGTYEEVKELVPNADGLINGRLYPTKNTILVGGGYDSKKGKIDLDGHVPNSAGYFLAKYVYHF